MTILCTFTRLVLIKALKSYNAAGSCVHHNRMCCSLNMWNKEQDLRAMTKRTICNEKQTTFQSVPHKAIVSLQKKLGI